jgi:hypothetical protein
MIVFMSQQEILLLLATTRKILFFFDDKPKHNIYLALGIGDSFVF